MSQVSNPRSAERRGRRPQHDERDSRPAAPRSLALRVRVAASRDRLNRQLAQNADPASSPALSLRAFQLTRARRRKQMVRTLRGIVRDAFYPRLTRPPVVTINRAAVRDAEAAINAMIARLNGPEPVRAQGMAIAERMLTDGAQSPLYMYGQPGTLRRLVLAATAALDSTPEATHEFPIPV